MDNHFTYNTTNNILGAVYRRFEHYDSMPCEHSKDSN